MKLQAAPGRRLDGQRQEVAREPSSRSEQQPRYFRRYRHQHRQHHLCRRRHGEMERGRVL